MESYLNKLGIFSWFGFVMPLPERLRLIKKAGFSATSLWWEDEIGHPPIKKEDMSAMVRDAGLFLENIHVPYDHCDDLWSDNQLIRDNIVNRHISWLKDCYRYNIPLMVMHINDKVDLPAPGKYGLDSISCILKAAEDLGVAVAIENTGRTDYVQFVLSEIDSRFLGFCYDSSHDKLYNKVEADLLEKLAPHLITTHLSDNDGEKDRHWLPGQGVIDWERVKNAFPRATYKGCLTLEVCSGSEDVNQSPQDFLTKAYQQAQWVRKVLSRL